MACFHRYTAPNLKDFRVVRVRGWRRVFAHCAPIFFERGIARLDTREMSSLSTEKCEGASFIATMFEIPMEDYPALEQREAEFILAPVVAELPEPRNVLFTQETNASDHREPVLGRLVVSCVALLCIACSSSRHWTERLFPALPYYARAALTRNTEKSTASEPLYMPLTPPHSLCARPAFQAHILLSPPPVPHVTN
eukprot:1182572-Prorocentrum_minimum.AAC.5